MRCALSQHTFVGHTESLRSKISHWMLQVSTLHTLLCQFLTKQLPRFHCASAAITGLGLMLEGSLRWCHAQPSAKSNCMPAKAADQAVPLLLTHCCLLLKICKHAEKISSGLCQFAVLNCRVLERIRCLCRWDSSAW